MELLYREQTNVFSSLRLLDYCFVDEVVENVLRVLA